MWNQITRPDQYPFKTLKKYSRGFYEDDNQIINIKEIEKLLSYKKK